MNIEQKAWNRVKMFLTKSDFSGFTADDLFIKRFIPKGWGQDVAALSYMAEAILKRTLNGTLAAHEAQRLIGEVISRALHQTVSPYRQTITAVNDLGKHGYYLEHLNIALGIAGLLGKHDYTDLHLRVSNHLQQLSLDQKNAHSPLMPNVKMRWSADQAAILKSLWLCDQVHQTSLHKEPSERWLEYMHKTMTHKATGLFQTEVMRVKKYSKQPRGCSLAYLIHYTSSFAPEVAKEQWGLLKQNMYQSSIGLSGFREYLPSYSGKWTPDTGPIIGGTGVAATGLALNAAADMGDEETYASLKSSIDRVLMSCHLTKHIPGLNMLTAIGTDVLASAIYASATAGFSEDTVVAESTLLMETP
jgi:hypothetical protein